MSLHGIRGRDWKWGESKEDPAAAKQSPLGSRLLAALEVVLLIAFLLFALVRPFVLEPFYVPSDSMVPALQPGDRILADKVSYRFREPRRGEIVVFNGSESFGEAGELYVKRIVGLPGETLRITHGITYIDAKPLPEGYLKSRPYADFDSRRVPPDSYFVMGDNRNDSRDSRFWGPIPQKTIIGDAVCIFWPLHRIRGLH